MPSRSPRRPSKRSAPRCRPAASATSASAPIGGYFIWVERATVRRRQSRVVWIWKCQAGKTASARRGLGRRHRAAGRKQGEGQTPQPALQGGLVKLEGFRVAAEAVNRAAQSSTIRNKSLARLASRRFNRTVDHYCAVAARVLVGANCTSEKGWQATRARLWEGPLAAGLLAEPGTAAPVPRSRLPSASLFGSLPLRRRPRNPLAPGSG